MVEANQEDILEPLRSHSKHNRNPAHNSNAAATSGIVLCCLLRLKHGYCDADCFFCGSHCRGIVINRCVARRRFAPNGELAEASNPFGFEFAFVLEGVFRVSFAIGKCLFFQGVFGERELGELGVFCSPLLELGPGSAQAPRMP